MTEQAQQQDLDALQQDISDINMWLVRLDERQDADRKAVQLQAAEYERRLDALNHAHERAVQVQHTYVTQDKYEDKVHAEASARSLALERIDEKFNDHVKRYELRQREIDLNAAALKSAQELIAQTAATTAAAAKEESSREADRAKQTALAVERRANRNLTIVGIAVAVISIGASLIQNI